MTCLEAQGMIVPFINDELAPDKLEEFLEHIEKCSDCKEELEVYYILLTGMKQLDEEENVSGNFHLAFENKLKRAEDFLARKKINTLRKKIILCVIIFFIGVFTSMGIGEYTGEDILPDSDHVLSQSSFRLKKYDFFGDKLTLFQQEIDQYREDLLRYKEEQEKKRGIRPNVIENVK